MLKALLVGTALTLAVAAPSIAQNAPATPGTQRPAPPAAQPATPPMTSPQSPAMQNPGATAPARMEGSHLIGLSVRNSANESIGSIDDVLVDADGRVRQVVVSVGGFLGIGDRKVAIGWDQLRFDRQRDVAMVNLTKDQVRAMPEYRASTAPGTRQP